MTSITKISLLLIDDKLSFGQAFMLQHDDEFTVYHERYLSAAEEKLRSDFYKYDFVILDGLGHTVEGLAEDRGEDKHAYLGLKLISELSNTFGRKLPCCVYTAYLSDSSIKLLQEVNPDLKVFEKGPGEAAMLQYIREEYASQPEATFRMNHPEIARIFDQGWLSRENERELISLFSNIDVNNNDQLKHKTDRIRPMMEAIFERIAITDRSLLPRGLGRNQQQSLRLAINHIAGDPKWNNDLHKLVCDPSKPAILPLHLWYTLSALQNATSIVAMHHYEHPISRYTLASYANILADFMLWFSDFMQKRA